VASTLTKRPLPALVALLALLLLTALVWWRVLHRGGGGGSAAASCPTHTASATLPAPARITLSVLNATKRSGIAARARTTLVGDGFNVPKAAANDSPKAKVPGVAEIRYGPKAKTEATMVHYYFPGARMVATKGTTSTVVVSLGAKYRSVATATTVQAALRRADIALDAPASDSAGASPSASC
jgi:hypothetical protein